MWKVNFYLYKHAKNIPKAELWIGEENNDKYTLDTERIQQALLIQIQPEIKVVITQKWLGPASRYILNVNGHIAFLALLLLRIRLHS